MIHVIHAFQAQISEYTAWSRHKAFISGHVAETGSYNSTVIDISTQMCKMAQKYRPICNLKTTNRIHYVPRYNLRRCKNSIDDYRRIIHCFSRSRLITNRLYTTFCFTAYDLCISSLHFKHIADVTTWLNLISVLFLGDKRLCFQPWLSTCYHLPLDT